MAYSIGQFRKTFPTEESCWEFLFKTRFPDKKGYTKLTTRGCFQNAQGHQIYPQKGTIFAQSKTSLWLWFYAIYLFSISKNGVSARELSRQLGVTEKCAWRMGHKIREAMKQDKDLLSGIVESDETFFGIRSPRGHRRKKYPIMGMVERGGKARAMTIPKITGYHLTTKILENVKPESRVMTDESKCYRYLRRNMYYHSKVHHSDGIYSYQDDSIGTHVSTNAVEGLWSLFKRSIFGTHSFVSQQHLQKYLDERVFHYNHRKTETPLFWILLQLAIHPPL